jgi:hypothetical protein
MTEILSFLAWAFVSIIVVTILLRFPERKDRREGNRS